MCLTVCPLSNVKLCVVDDIAAHPLRTMLDAGLRATVNSDDPAYFGGYVNANYRAVADALDLSRADLVTLARNSFASVSALVSRSEEHTSELQSLMRKSYAVICLKKKTT